MASCNRKTAPPKTKGFLGLPLMAHHAPMNTQKLLLWWGLATLSGWACAADADRVRLPGWWVDTTEVTIARFNRYATATGLLTESERAGGGFEYDGGWVRRPGWTWRQPDGQTPASDRLPAVHLTFEEAQGFCHWAGGRLPTAAEWMASAYTELRQRPPAPWTKGQTYPWPTGNTPQGANTNGPDPWPRAAPAGATVAGVNGLHDMGGNVWEWVTDARGGERRTMGGSWWYGPAPMAADHQAWKPHGFYAVYIGFRCVYPVQDR
ncbi:MAG: hypothetical protein RJA09_2704 [Pseudomonadota bacterium]